MKKPLKYFLQGLALALLALALLFSFAGSRPEKRAVRDPAAKQMEEESAKWFATERTLTQFSTDMKEGKVKTIGVGFDYALVTTDVRYYVRVGMQRPLFQEMLTNKANKSTPAILSLGDLAPAQHGPAALAKYAEPGYLVLLVMLALAIMSAKQMGMLNGVGGGSFRFASKPSTKFADVVGVEEAKDSMQDLVAFLKDPQKFTALGAKPPRGVLMCGPPGTGKTRLAQAVAGEAGVAFISLTGSDFAAKFLGVGVSRVKELFAMARRHAPAVIFIDELDGLGVRNSGMGTAGDGENDRVINAILVELDGFASSEGIIVIGATNHPEKVDPSIVRPGRFDRTVHLSLPTIHERETLYALYAGALKQVNWQDIDIAQLARLSTNLSPAAIATVVNAAALLAAKEGAVTVTQAHFVRALDGHRIGSPNSASKAALTEQERRRVAWHEAGHAIIGRVVGTDVDRVTIIPHGPGLGLTLFDAPERRLYTYEQVSALVLTLLGGRAAEKLALNSTSTGASDDLKRATSLVYSMVTQYGFGKSAGLISFAGLPTAVQRDSLPAEVFAEIRSMLEEFEKTVDETLQTHRPALDALAERLLAEETVPGAVVDECIARGKVAPRAA